jgi:hypothetical protein
LAKGDELVKYVTEQLLDYIETPKEVRRQVREHQKEIRVNWQYRWFGMIPFAIRMWLDGLRHKK